MLKRMGTGDLAPRAKKRRGGCRGRKQKPLEVTVAEVLVNIVEPWLKMTTRTGLVGFVLTDLRGLMRAHHRSYLTQVVEHVLIGKGALRVDHTSGIGYIDRAKLVEFMKSLPGPTSGRVEAARAIVALAGATDPEAESLQAEEDAKMNREFDAQVEAMSSKGDSDGPDAA